MLNGLNLLRPLLLFDLETTSSEPERARIVSYAHRLHLPGVSEVSEYKTLVNPGVPIPPESTLIHGITDAMVQGCRECGRPEHEDVHRFEDEHKTHDFKPWPKFSDLAQNFVMGFFTGVDFGGMNIRFDLRVMREEFKRLTPQIDFNYYHGAYLLDAHVIWQRIERRSLENAVERFCGRKLEGAHDALTDVQAAEDVLIGQLSGHYYPLDQPDWKAFPVPADGPLTMELIHKWCFPPDLDRIDSLHLQFSKFRFIDGVPCFDFGEHKGKPLVSQRGYLAWICGPKSKGFSEEVRTIAREALAGKLPVRRTE